MMNCDADRPVWHSERHLLSLARSGCSVRHQLSLGWCRDTSDSEVENFFSVAPKAAVLLIEVRLVKEPEGEAGGALESVVDLDTVDLEMAG